MGVGITLLAVSATRACLQVRAEKCHPASRCEVGRTAVAAAMCESLTVLSL